MVEGWDGHLRLSFDLRMGATANSEGTAVRIRAGEILVAIWLLHCELYYTYIWHDF